MEVFEIIIANALIRAAKETFFFSSQKKYHNVCFWDNIADEIRDNNINEKEIDLFFRSAANNLYDLISNRQQIMLPPINELQDATTDLKKIVLDFRRVFPIDKRTYQIPYFDDRIVIYYSRVGIIINNDQIQPPTTTPQQKPFAGLLRKLKTEQLDKLFVFLTTDYVEVTELAHKEYGNTIKIKFIDSDTTDRDSFNHIFGGKDIQKPVVPIEWKANNQWLREILAGLQIKEEYTTNETKGTKTRKLSNVIERQAEKYFTKKSTEINIKSTKQLQDKPQYRAIITFLATL